MKILVYLFLTLIVMLVLFLSSACIVSGRCSREEEKNRNEE